METKVKVKVKIALLSQTTRS